MKEFGKIYTGLSVHSIMRNADLYAQDLLDHKALVFRGLNPEDGEFPELAKAISLFGPDVEMGFNCHEQDHNNMFDTNPEFSAWDSRDPETMLHDPKNPSSFEAGWHCDQAPQKKPTSIVGMYMHTFKIPKGVGNTVLMDLERIWHLFDKQNQEYLKTISFDHRYSGYQLPPDSDPTDGFHPAVREHPVTSTPALYWSGGCCVPAGLNEEYELEMDNYGTCFTAAARADRDFEHFAETMMTLMGRGPELVEKWAGITNPDVVFTQEWEEGDVMIWDNRNTVHTFHGGWRLGERVFRKLELGLEPVKAAF
tara:strand:+ start:7475 stop:8401 length:927 start_codon:yes stop_codon:yes gene_type:complete